MSIVDFSASIAVAESARQVFQEILDNLLAFNESSPTIFAEAETYLAAASTGLSQAAQSWDASTQTYLPPRRDADLSWKGTINTGWTKRQEMIEEVKRQNAKKTEFDRIAEMDYDDLLHNYSEIISAKESGDLNSPYYKPNKTEYRIKLEKAVVKRYEEVKDLPRKNNVSKYTLQKVDPFFKAKIDRMNQKELEEYYPGLKFSPIAPILDHNYYSSEIDKANDIYLAARYQELDSQNPISKHDPNFEQKRFEYISRTGLDPVTGKEADKELLNYATNYTKYAPSIKAGYDFLMVGTAAWSTRAYNKDIQTQRADAQINEYYKIKDAVRNSSVGSQPVVGPQLPSKNWTLELPKVETKTIMGSQSMVSEINPGGNTDAPAINTGGVEVSNNLKFNLNDIDSFDNANIKSVEAFLDNELQGYRKAPLKRGDGVRYYDGKGNSWQLNYGYENATDNIHGKPYLKTTYNGEIVRIPLQK